MSYDDLPQRRGKFLVSVGIIENAPESALHLIDGCFPYKSELRYDLAAFEIHALCPLFEPVPGGMKTPWYDLVLTGEQKKFRKRLA